jgi:hypothetical protein
MSATASHRLVRSNEQGPRESRQSRASVAALNAAEAQIEEAAFIGHGSLVV